MVFTREAPVQAAANLLALDDRLFNLSEEDYRGAAGAHRAIGTLRGYAVSSKPGSIGAAGDGLLHGNNFWLRKHLVEETGGFARDITR